MASCTGTPESRGASAAAGPDGNLNGMNHDGPAMRIIGVDDDPWDDEYEREAGDEAGFAPAGESVEALVPNERPDEVLRARYLLAPVQKSMEQAGFYAYSTFDQEQRLTIASDDEDGRFDIWVDGDDYVITLWSSDPGLYMDEENEWRRRAMERLARIAIPRVSQGMLASHQQAMWDDEDHGVAVRLTFRLPTERAADVGPFVRERIPELNELLGFVERQLS
jgi:hypothetical protein